MRRTPRTLTRRGHCKIALEPSIRYSRTAVRKRVLLVQINRSGSVEMVHQHRVGQVWSLPKCIDCAAGQGVVWRDVGKWLIRGDQHDSTAMLVG